MTGDSRTDSRTGTVAPHPAWLPDAAFAPLGGRRVAVVGTGPVVETVRVEVAGAVARHGGQVVDTARTDDPWTEGRTGVAGGSDSPGAPTPQTGGQVVAKDVDLLLTVTTGGGDGAGVGTSAAEGFDVHREGATLVVHADGGPGLLYGLHHVVRHGEAAFVEQPPATLLGRHEPAEPIRMLDHWDNLTVHPVMGQVERGYAGGSIFWSEGRLVEDLSRAREYARLLGSIGVNRVAVNNVNVGGVAARLLTDGLADVARLAEAFRPHGIRTHISVSFAAPMTVGGLPTSDPLDPDVQRWWARAAERVWAEIPDFGGFVVKADSEGQPGPFAYGRDHADGANMLARAVAPHGGTIFWRAFVYNHKQDWRDRSTDRARAAYDHFAPLDGRFDENVVVQVKHGPLDFQTREAISPVIAAMPRTRVAVELQVTQEYTGQQKHVCYLGTQWSEILGFGLWGPEGPSLADVAAGRGPGERAAGIVAVSNVGDDEFWTGHPLAQANLYAFGRLAWDPTLDATAVLDEWARLTHGDDPSVLAALHDLMDGSWRTYEDYTAPLGVGFMVSPARMHYGPDVDGYEYSQWGTYHFADRDGVGVDRTRATGTGYTGQYPEPWRDVYESLDTCPDELLLFFHHVPYTHVLHDGVTVIQHIYDTHFRGLERVEEMVRTWEKLEGRVDERVFARVTERLAEQLRSAREWRDQINTYFWRKSGIPDAHGRTIY